VPGRSWDRPRRHDGPPIGRSPEQTDELVKCPHAFARCSFGGSGCEEVTVAPVVLVHGVGQQVYGERTLLAQWRPALLDGLKRAGVTAVPDTAMAFYGDLYRAAGETLAAGEPMYTAADVTTAWEIGLLTAWWEYAAETDERVAPPDGDTLVRTPNIVQRALLHYDARLKRRGRCVVRGAPPADAPTTVTTMVASWCGCGSRSRTQLARSRRWPMVGSAK
jgi:hypothetical protein